MLFIGFYVVLMELFVGFVGFFGGLMEFFEGVRCESILLTLPIGELAEAPFS